MEMASIKFFFAGAVVFMLLLILTFVFAMIAEATKNINWMYGSVATLLVMFSMLGYALYYTYSSDSDE